MIDCDSFHETKRERKYYEGKKQKALRYIQKLSLDPLFFKGLPEPVSFELSERIARVWDLVNDI